MTGRGQSGNQKGKQKAQTVSQPVESSSRAETSHTPQTTQSQNTQGVSLPDATFRCRHKGCGKPYGSEAGRRGHELKHNPLEFECEHCDETFPSIKDSNYHKVTAHNEPSPYKDLNCRFCGKASTTKTLRVKHEKKFHQKATEEAAKRIDASGNPTEPWVCRFQECQSRFTFSSKGEADRHMSTAHPYSSDPNRDACKWYDCNQRRGDRNALDLHERHHENIDHCRSGECHMYPSGFKTKDERNNHERDFHPIQLWCLAEQELFFSSEQKMMEHLREAHVEWLRAQETAAGLSAGQASQPEGDSDPMALSHTHQSQDPFIASLTSRTGEMSIENVHATASAQSYAGYGAGDGQSSSYSQQYSYGQPAPYEQQSSYGEPSSYEHPSSSGQHNSPEEQSPTQASTRRRRQWETDPKPDPPTQASTRRRRQWETDPIPDPPTQASTRHIPEWVRNPRPDPPAQSPTGHTHPRDDSSERPEDLSSKRRR